MPPETMTAPDESGMDDSLYSDDSASDKTEKETPESVDEEESQNPTALIPTSALGGNAKQGDTITMRVVKVHGEEVEVEISSSSSKKTKNDSMTPSEELDEMDSMKGPRGGL